ncbi:hypothetical protein, conserved [Trypanosoma brucei gambiense DAL972]|uniref:tRNA:m(4)X modification enzyme TRM13 n=1 Tax=Trypanosoma brucei gambiense (strain MHOM/CI/86/DAL972) TaxID=679716 RepID=C9ZN61_TRYB9|nr:hypothetical protein, conserved [Trypanosoma brucei gambiense DAL972]CBH10715.1 hypothetical protein, conserved [Trypanosoma brucei gambiense DAL972]|eukprot:XP_011773003.1 hypothetical protein, conserved [Trypanosoma brucei gambiense DAL972]
MDATTQEGEGTGKGQMRPTHNPDAVACDFYLSHKRRFCRTAKRAGGRYCPTHDVNGTTTGETTPAVVLSSSGSAVGPGRTAGEGVSTGPSRALQRVPCPINPNHTVYADKLQKHVKVCPDLRFVVDKLPYYSKDLHACKGVAYCVTSQESEKERFTHHHMDTVVLEDLITRVRECYFNVIQPRIVLLAEECQEPFQDNSSTGSTRRISNKHGPQHRALLRCVQTVIRGYAEGRGNLGNTYVRIAGFLELGAGKAGLAVSLQDALLSGSIRYCHSHPGFQERKEGRTAVNEALSADNGDFPRIVVVDMDNFRRKADACVRNSRLPLVRLRINIKDLDLAKALCGASACKRSREETSSTSDQCTNAIKQSVPVEEQWVAFGKHLCGACTDFALSCVTAPNLNTEGFASVCAVVFATCCHQRCELKHINALLSPSECRRGRIAIPGTNHTFSEREFAAITSMSSWAVSGEAVDAERRLTGMCCKRVIDAFRLEYLKQSGFRRTYLCQYAESSVTGENICIVAFR